MILMTARRKSPIKLNNLLFLNEFILIKFCTNKSITLQNHNLSVFLTDYSQSYPQLLWVSIFLHYYSQLQRFNNIFSSYRKQLIDAI